MGRSSSTSRQIFLCHQMFLGYSECIPWSEVASQIRMMLSSGSVLRGLVVQLVDARAKWTRRNYEVHLPLRFKIYRGEENAIVIFCNILQMFKLNDYRFY